MKRILILITLLSIGSSFTNAQTDSTGAKLEVFECYDRFSLKDQWAQVVELVTTLSVNQPIDLEQIFEATGDYPFGYVKQENVPLFDSLMNLQAVKQLLPSDLRFYWSLKSEDKFRGKNYYSVHAIKLPREGTSVLNGSHIAKAEAGYSAVNELDMITLTMTPEGTKLWATVTERNFRKALAIVVDNKVFSAPIVYSVITGSQTEISGTFSKEEAEAYAAAINAGIIHAKQSTK